MPSAMTAPNRCSVPGTPCRLQQLDQPGPRPGWAALDAAGHRRLTGSLTLHLQPDVTVWFHEGRVLFAEREGGPSPEAILLNAGVVTAEQLAHGVIALGPVRNLGRLFDRVPELDPDVVELAVELATAELLGEVADRTADAVTVEPYRLHPSGLHHWAERSHEQPLEAAAQRVRTQATESPTGPGSTSDSTWPDATSTIAPAVPAPSAPVEDDASVAVVATPAPTRPVDEPVDDRAVGDAFATSAVTSPTVSSPTVDPHPDSDPHPAVDLRRLIEEVAAESAGDPGGAPFRTAASGLLPDEPTDVPDDVRAAVRLALAEIVAATRPSVTDGLVIESLLEPALVIDDNAAHDGHDEGLDADDHHGLRRLLGGRHP